MVSKSTPIFVDNKGIVLNATHPNSTLNKKNVALAYHFAREHVASEVVKIKKIDSEDSFADPFTKALQLRENSSNYKGRRSMGI
eukprot:14059347-Ditylum_brightwellii.AAC.1